MITSIVSTAFPSPWKPVVSTFSTAVRASLGYFLDAACLAVNDDWLMLIIWSTSSCVMVGFLLCVLYAGEFSCTSSNVGVLDTLGDGVMSYGAVVVVLLGYTLTVVTLACISRGGSSCVVVGLIFVS